MGFLRRNWFLLLLTASALVAWGRPNWLAWTAHVEPRLIVGSALFLSAWSLNSRDLFHAFVRPMPAIWAVLISYALVPFLAWLLGKWMPGEDFRIGLLIVASVPCTVASSLIWTRLAGGNDAVALLVSVLTTATSWLVTTAWLTFGSGTAVEVNGVAMMRGLFLVLVVPFTVGQGLRGIRFLAQSADRYKTVLGVLSRLLILTVILKAMANVFAELHERTGAMPVWALFVSASAAAGLHSLALYVGLGTSRLWKFARAEQIAVGFSCSQKTLPVSLYLASTYFAGYPLALVPIAIYHVGQLFIDTWVANWLNSTAPPAPAVKGDTEVEIEWEET
ncbi:MAG: transporter [Gemmatales bacterium]|nr:MAG: transporter [Gemmatales bacterium]